MSTSAMGTTERPQDVSTSPTKAKRRFPSIEGVWYLLVVLLVVGAFVNPNFASPGNLNNILVGAAPAILLAVGQTFVLLGREIDLSVGSIVGFSAVICGNFMNHDAALAVPVALLAILVAMLMGLFNGVVTVAFGIPSFVVTLGSMLVIRGMINVWTGGAPASGIPDELTAWLTGTRIGGFAVGVLIVVIFGVGIAYVLAHRTVFGRRLVLTGANPRAVVLAGLHANRTLIAAFAVNGAFAGLAGVYYAAWTGSVRGDIGTGMELVAIAAAVLGGVALTGGRGSVISAAAGAIALSVILNLLIVAGLPFEAQDVGRGLIIIVAVLAYDRLRTAFGKWRVRRRIRSEHRLQLSTEKLQGGTAQ